MNDRIDAVQESIKLALDAADASTSGPVTIRVSPGSFEEITPLVVPANVTIIGEDMRNTIIRPESAYQSNDIFLLEDNTTIMIAPTPSSTSNGEVVHVSRPTTLTSASPDNYFTQFCYDALFNACMVESYIFMKNFQIVPLFEQRYQTSIQTVRNRARRFRRDDMTRPASPAGADNTVVDGSN